MAHPRSPDALTPHGMVGRPRCWRDVLDSNARNWGPGETQAPLFMGLLCYNMPPPHRSETHMKKPNPLTTKDAVLQTSEYPRPRGRPAQAASSTRTIRLPEAVWEQVSRRSKKDGLSINAWVAQAVDEALSGSKPEPIPLAPEPSPPPGDPRVSGGSPVLAPSRPSVDAALAQFGRPRPAYGALLKGKK